MLLEDVLLNKNLKKFTKMVFINICNNSLNSKLHVVSDTCMRKPDIRGGISEDINI